MNVNHQSIGIEVVNYGYTEADGETIYGNYISTSELIYSSWNGHDYWQAFTEAQYESLNQLVPYLLDKHGIAEIYHDSLDYISSDSDVENFSGVIGHSALQNGKSDPGPVFDFSRLIP